MKSIEWRQKFGDFDNHRMHLKHTPLRNATPSAWVDASISYSLLHLTVSNAFFAAFCVSLHLFRRGA